MNQTRSFASDNNSGVHPEVMEALARVNVGHVIGYGDDPYTRHTTQMFQQIFGDDVDVFFVFLGTAANVLGLSSALRSYQAVICTETAHINVDECGAPEKFTSGKLIDVPTPDGKLTVERIAAVIHGVGDQHHVQPKVISITQSTELGTLYSVEEICAIADFAHKNNMLLHMDGARISNAAAALGLPFRVFTRDAGVDILSFGGTKNGMMFGEAVVFFNKSLAETFPFVRKQGMQLASKMRYIAAQFEAMLSNDLWLRNARHSNEMAKLLEKGVSAVPGVRITQRVEVNAIFAIIPPHVVELLREHYFFYTWDEHKSEVRWMTSFDTTEEDVRGFVNTLKQVMEQV